MTRKRNMFEDAARGREQGRIAAEVTGTAPVSDGDKDKDHDLSYTRGQ